MPLAGFVHTVRRRNSAAIMRVHPGRQERLRQSASASHADEEPVEDVEGRAGQQRGERVEARDELQVVEVCLVHGIGG